LLRHGQRRPTLLPAQVVHLSFIAASIVTVGQSWKRHRRASFVPPLAERRSLPSGEKARLLGSLDRRGLLNSRTIFPVATSQQWIVSLPRPAANRPSAEKTIGYNMLSLSHCR